MKYKRVGLKTKVLCSVHKDTRLWQHR